MMPLAAPKLPQFRGPLSDALIQRLQGQPGPLGGLVEADDPWFGEDSQLALYLCFELSYRGFAGVDVAWESEPTLIGLRDRLAGHFMSAITCEVGPPGELTPAEVVVELQRLASDDEGPSPSEWLLEHGTPAQMREFLVHRSAYQLKEADQHTWAIPRLPAGQAKSAFIKIQSDEYGNGEPGQSHQELFGATLRSLELDDHYGGYLDRIPAVTLATVNLLSIFGSAQRWLGACVGHLALFEMTSIGPMGRYATAIRRMTKGAEGPHFYDVHVEADAVHQELALHDMVTPLLVQMPELTQDVVFGARALTLVERAFSEHVVTSWELGNSSLRPLPSLVHAELCGTMP